MDTMHKIPRRTSPTIFAMPGCFLPDDSSPSTVGNIAVTEEIGGAIDNEVDVPVDRDADRGGSIMLDAGPTSVFWANGLVLCDKGVGVEAWAIGFSVLAVLGTVILIKSRKNCPPVIILVMFRVCSPMGSVSDWKKSCRYWIVEVCIPEKHPGGPLSML